MSSMHVLNKALCNEVDVNNLYSPASSGFVNAGEDLFSRIIVTPFS